MAKAEMTAALAKGVSWGIGEDARIAEEGSDVLVDWRSYSATHVRLLDFKQSSEQRGYVLQLNNTPLARVTVLSTSWMQPECKGVHQEQLAPWQALRTVGMTSDSWVCAGADGEAEQAGGEAAAQ